MNLGQKGKDLSGPVSISDSKNKVSYPSFTLRDDVAKDFLASYDCKIGDELTATIKLKVSGLRQDQFGSSVEFEALDLDNITKKGKKVEGKDAAADDESKTPAPANTVDEDAEEKILGYKRPAKNPVKETPDTSAESMY